MGDYARTQAFSFLLRNYNLPPVFRPGSEPECEMCSERLPTDEAERPTVVGGEIWCDDCYCEHHRFMCCVCGEYEEREIEGVEIQHRYLAVLDADEAGLDSTGLYRIKDRAYYTNMMLYTLLHDWMLERVADAPEPLVYYDYACGHLCLSCQEKFA